MDADSPINEATLSIHEVKEAVVKLRGGKAAGICNTSAELLRTEGEARIHGLHAVWLFYDIEVPFLLTGEGGKSFLSGKVKTVRIATTTAG